jgi:hypothetical protein
MDDTEQQEYTGKWDTRWKNNRTPWDLGEPAKVLVHLFQTLDLKDTGLALVPGCGRGI